MNPVNIAVGIVFLMIGFLILAICFGIARALKALSLMALLAAAYFGAIWLWGERGEFWFGIIAVVIAAGVYLIVRRRNLKGSVPPKWRERN
jgi:hypothetical protein